MLNVVAKCLLVSTSLSPATQSGQLWHCRDG